MTVLINAIARNKLYFIDKLLRAGADINLKSNIPSVRKSMEEMSEKAKIIL